MKKENKKYVLEGIFQTFDRPNNRIYPESFFDTLLNNILIRGVVKNIKECNV